MVAPQQQFCVKWNSYHTNLQNVFPKLLTSEHFVDVTLACDNGLIKCHKVVLSACSNYFENILIQNPCQHPTIVLKDMKCSEVQALVDFMYKGEVNVAQEDLPSLLKAAEGLQIRGLSNSEHCLNQMDVFTQKSVPVVAPPSCPPLAPVTPNIDQSANIPSTATSAIESATPTTVAFNGDYSDKTIKTEMAEAKKRKIDSIISDVTLKKDDSLTNNDNYETENDSVKDSNVIKQEENNFNEDDLDMDDGEDDGVENNGYDDNGQQSEYNASANVSCLYTKRIRRPETELKQAADCITRGQTFQTVSDHFNIPISTIRFFMARKGILPRRKRGRSSSNHMMNGTFQGSTTGGDRSDWNGL